MSDITITYYSLSDYNNAVLIPFTIDCEGQTADEHLEAIAEHLADITERLEDGELREEWIVCDYENIPSQYVGEYQLDNEFFEYLAELESSQLDAEAFAAGVSLGIPFESIEEAYHGEYSSDEEFAEEFAESCGLVDTSASWPNTCIDWEWAARELMYDFQEEDGHYFAANY